jgi:hypothetical protein
MNVLRYMLNCREINLRYLQIRLEGFDSSYQVYPPCGQMVDEDQSSFYFPLYSTGTEVCGMSRFVLYLTESSSVIYELPRVF